MTIDPDWNHLRTLLAFSRGGSLTAAAKALSVTHSTVSRQLSELEGRVGSRLFRREPEGRRLTAAGERLVAAAEEMETRLRQAQEDIGSRETTLRGAVRIGAPDAFGAIFLAPRIAQFMERNPGVEVQLVAMPHVFNLTKREADIAIALSVPERGRLVAKKLSRYGLGLYGSAKYLNERPLIQEISQISEHNFISYISDLIFTKELDFLHELPPDLNVRFQSSNIIAQLHATRGGQGLCVLPHFLANEYDDLIHVLPEKFNILRTWWLIVHEDQRTLRVIREVQRFIIDQVRANSTLLQKSKTERVPSTSLK